MIKRCLFLFLLLVLFPLGVHAQITPQNYQQYIGQTLYFDPHKPWHASYALGNKSLNELQKNGVAIHSIVVNNDKLSVTLQDLTTGSLQALPFSQEVPLYFVSTTPYATDDVPSPTDDTHTISTQEDTSTYLKVGNSFLNAFVGPLVTPQKIQGVKWANGGFSVGLQLMEQISPVYATGFEFSNNIFLPATTTSFVYPITITQRISGRNTQFMLANRLTLNPESDTRFYIPFALGVQNSRMTYRLWGGPISVSDSARDTSLAYYIGLGLEKEIKDHAIIGIEARYNAFKFKADKWDINERPYFYSIILKFGPKF